MRKSILEAVSKEIARPSLFVRITDGDHYGIYIHKSEKGENRDE
jgi:hypothetical protein